MPTAFCAVPRSGGGAVIGLYCESDAVQGTRQAASTRRELRPIYSGWPNYITTPRGQDWWNRSTLPGA